MSFGGRSPERAFALDLSNTIGRRDQCAAGRIHFALFATFIALIFV
jgi:hypothetical protein